MPSELFKTRVIARASAEAGDSRILIRVDYTQAVIRFLGASCDASVKPNNEALNSFTLFPTPGKPALVALAVVNKDKHPDEWTRAYFLDITWREGSLPWVDLDEAWIPSRATKGQALEWGITVQIGKVTYSSDFHDEKRQSATLRLVPDGNLLCRFLIGDATSAEVQAAAETFKEEEAWPAQKAALEQAVRILRNDKMSDARELDALRDRIKTLLAETSETRARCAKLEADLQNIQNAYNASEKIVRIAGEECHDLREQIVNISHMAGENLGFGKRGRALLGIAGLCQSILSTKRRICPACGREYKEDGSCCGNED